MKNLQRTNTNEFKLRSYNYLVDCLRTEENETEDSETVVRDFLASYETTGNYEYNKKKIPNNQARLADHLSGLPTNLPWSTDQVLQDAKELHQCTELTAKEEQIIINNHWNFWALQIMRLEDLTINRKLNKFLQ